jgi:hypothetical protein
MSLRDRLSEYCGVDLQYIKQDKYDIAIVGIIENIYATWNVVYDVEKLSRLGFNNEHEVDDIIYLHSLGIEEYDTDNKYIVESAFPYLPYLHMEYDAAIIGCCLTADGVETVCYSREKLLELIQGVSNVDPMEYYYFRIHSEFMGDNTPLFLITINEIENAY